MLCLSLFYLTLLGVELPDHICPTGSAGDYSRGFTLRIQSFFEARRRAQGVTHPGDGEQRWVE